MSSFQDAFISYGRADSKAFAIKLYQHLTEYGLEVWFDFEDIPLGVDFQNQIDDGIEKADNFLFLIAPHSINSLYCRKEIELAIKRHKRIIPLLHVEQISRDTWQQRHPQGTDPDWEAYRAKGLHSSFPNMHPEIGKINWVYFREGIDDFDKSLAGLLEIFARHKDYVHQHSHFLAKALEWEKHQQQTRYLLVGEERQQAEDWLKVRFQDEQPPCNPTDLHCEYITESIKNAHNLMTQVFLAYAQEDKAVMEKIRNSLRREGFTVWTNTTDIQTGETFEKALERGIEQADNMVYLLSPAALTSDYCQKELNYALLHNKRIIPVLVQATDSQQIPLELRGLQYIDLTDNVKEEDYRLDENQLIKILHQEEAYYQEHKLLLVQAIKWKQQHDNPSILLRGYNLRHAEAWLKVARQRQLNPPTALQEEYIAESLRQPPATSLDVFISYSRTDSDFARKLNDTLQMQGKTTWFDQESIASGSDFQQEIYRGIEVSNNFLFILSPRAINSPYCADEVEYAAKLNKRFVTVLHQAVNPTQLHPELAKIQWIDFNKNETDFANTFSQLIRTLDTDREHVQNHTKWSQRALEWEEKGRNEDLLLRGSEFAIAQNWLQTALEEKKQPPPTALQQTFIDDSHKAILGAAEAEKRRQAELLRLQQEKTKEAEARLAEEKKSARRQKMFLSAVSVGFIIVTGLAVVSVLLLKKALELEAESLADYSDALFVNNRKLDALVEVLKAKRVLKNLWWVSNDHLTDNVNGNLQQAVFGLRQFNTLSGHKAPVLAIAISPDQKTIASSSEDNTINLWTWEGKFLRTFKGHNDSINAVAFSPDRKLIASASVDKTIKLWLLDGTLFKTLNGHTDKVNAAAFSPNGKLIASGSDDKTVNLWKLDGKLHKTLNGHTDKVKAVAFSPDGKLIASGSSDKTVKLWKLDGTLLKTLNGHSDDVEAVAFSPNGMWIASASDDNTIRLWKLDGTPVRTLRGHSDQVMGVAFNPNSKVIASASWDRSIKLWKLDGGLLATLLGHSDKVTSVAVAPHGKTLISGSEDNTVKFWSRETRFLKILYGHENRVNKVAFSSDKEKEKQLIVSVSDDKTVKLWRRDSTLLKTLWEAGKVNDVSFSPDGQIIVTGNRERKVTLWKRDGTLLRTIPETENVNQVSFSPNGKVIASASDDDTVKIWRAEDGTRLAILKGHRDKVMSVAFSPDNKLIATGSADNTIMLWNWKGQPLSRLTAHEGRVNDVSFSPDGKLIASGSVDDSVRLWKLDGIRLTLLSEGKHEQSVNAVVFSPDGKWIASASADQTVKLWDANGWKSDEKPQTTFYAHSDAVNGVAFSLDSQTIASASSDNTVLLWNIQQALDINKLQVEGCDLLRNYRQTNTEFKDDFHICDGVSSGK